MNEAVLLQTMTLVSTLSTTLELWHARSERQAGRDPSEQESHTVAVAELMAASAQLEEYVARVRASLVLLGYDTDGDEAASVRRFDAVLTLHRMHTLLHTVHQRLLSLYPTVSEDLVEEARHLVAALQDFDREDPTDHEAPDFDGLAPLLDQISTFLTHLAMEL